MDLDMPGMGGIEATKQLTEQAPHVGILIVTYLDSDSAVFDSLRAGARGYIVKGASLSEIVIAIQAVKIGGTFYGQAAARHMVAYFDSLRPLQPPGPKKIFPELTDSERDVLLLMARGRSKGEIASQLNLSAKTVSNYSSNILHKLQVASSAQAIVRAVQEGLLTQGQKRS